MNLPLTKREADYLVRLLKIQVTSQAEILLLKLERLIDAQKAK